MPKRRSDNAPEVRESNDRLVVPATGGEPKDENVHTRWVRATDKRVREAEQQGYVKAEESDVVEGHDGWLKPDGSIQNGDLILMKTNRERVEERERQMRETAAYRHKRAVSESDKEYEIETDPSHGSRRSSGKRYFYG